MDSVVKLKITPTTGCTFFIQPSFVCYAGTQIWAALSWRDPGSSVWLRNWGLCVEWSLSSLWVKEGWSQVGPWLLWRPKKQQRLSPQTPADGKGRDGRKRREARLDGIGKSQPKYGDHPFPREICQLATGMCSPQSDQNNSLINWFAPQYRPTLINSLFWPPSVYQEPVKWKYSYFKHLSVI